METSTKIQWPNFLTAPKLLFVFTFGSANLIIVGFIHQA
jgi:hypothetical protein